MGYRPEKTTRRFTPRASVTRCMVGVSSDVAQFPGTGKRPDHVRPPSALRFIWMAPLPWPLGSECPYPDDST